MKPMGKGEKPNIVAKEKSHIHVINQSLWGGHCKEKMHLNKEDPEDKFYGGA